MDILIVTRIDDTVAHEYGHTIRNVLLQNSHHVLYDQSYSTWITPDTPLFEKEKAPDMVVVIGGDGTILLTAQRMPHQVPMIGINRGEVGFLADLEPEEAEAFLCSIPREIPVEKRMRISFAVNGTPCGDALNEVLIVTDRPAKMLKFLIHIDGIVSEMFRADGLIMSTPTGSTAYAMSAGGPIVDPRLEGFLMVPLAPFMLSNRPHLISSERTVRITLELDAKKPAKLVIDGLKEIFIERDATIDITRSLEPALFVDANRNFFEKINRKLRHL